MLSIPQVEKFRKQDPYLHETLTQIISAINSLARQVGADPVGVAAAPPSIAALGATASNGQVNVQIVDRYPIANPATTKTLRYFVECSTDAGFVNVVHTEYLGPARNKNFVLGNQTLYFRAYSQLQNSPPSKPVAFGGSNPTAVAVGGSAARAQQPYQGSGTSTTSGQGYGAPVRGGRTVATQ